MNSRSLFRTLRLWLLFPFLVSIALAADPVVSNVTAAQRAGTKLVDITYDVAADTPTVSVYLRISSDGGSTFNVPANTLSGAIGAGVSTGTSKVITWNAGVDWLGNYSTSMRFELTADNAVSSTSEEFTYVAAGALPTGSWAGAQAVDAFFMAKTEVTWSEWQTVRAWSAGNGYDIGSVGAGEGPNRPVTNVSWHHVLKWCNARSESEGLTPVYKVGAVTFRTGDSEPTIDTTANGYRLPREKEWEFAARGGLQTSGFEYSGSNDINAVAWYSSNSGGSTKDVATKQANELGIFDMTGNVWEWCFDAYSDSDRVFRGGSWHWYDSEIICRVGSRSNASGNPTQTYPNVGFRVARNTAGAYSADSSTDTRYLTQFQIIEGSYTWHEAKADAEARGGRLAVLSTREKTNAADILIDQSGRPGCWIGLSDETQEGQWLWIDGSKLTFEKWDPGQPDNWSNEDYAHYWEGRLTWNDLRSIDESRLSYLMEIPPFCVTVSGTVFGSVEGSGKYEPSSTATIAATPSTGYRFTGWTGDASGTSNPLTITMDSDKTIGATYEKNLTDTDKDGITAYDEQVIYGTDPTKTDSDGDGLSDGYEVGLGRYSAVMGSRTWAQAATNAETLGGHLATFTTQREWDLAMASLGAEALMDVTGLWIGATDSATEGTWTWVTGEAFSFSNWNPGQPDNLNNSDYAAVAGDAGGESGKWYDYRAVITRDGYILETGYATNPADADSDDDGLSDGAEQTAHTNPLVADTDGDGVGDGVEHEFGGDPLNPAVVARWGAKLARSQGTSAFVLSFPTQTGSTYQIESTTNFGQWQIEESSIAGTGNVMTRAYPSENQPKRYFRVRRN